jgi:nitrile hydratase accessory protein
LSVPDLAGLPRDAEGAPVFAAPWQARAFALAVGLHDKGAFAWPDFAAALAAECARAPAADYYAAWLRALETLLAARAIAPQAEIEAVAGRWQRAAGATPHGQPIRLENAPA